MKTYLSLISCLLILFMVSCAKEDVVLMTVNPLPECESRWNCARMSVDLPVGAHEATQLVVDVIRDMHGNITKADAMSGDAVFRIPIFGYRDDLRFVTEPKPDGGCTLHLWSKSRQGRFDIGVNAHRLRRLTRLLGYELIQKHGTS